MWRPREAPRWTPMTKAFVSSLLLGLAIYLVYRFSVVIPPLILAAILAFVLSPLVDRLQVRLHSGRGVATILVYLVMVGVLVLAPVLIFPSLVEQARLLNLDFQDMAHSLEALVGSRVTIGGITLDGAALASQVSGALTGLLEPVFGQTLDIAFGVITSVLWVVFIMVISFYLVKDGARLWRWLEGLPPAPYRRDFIYLKNELNVIWTNFFRGQLVLAFVVGLVFLVVGLAVGLPFPLAMAVLAGLMEFIPTVGHGIWVVLAAVLVFFQGSTWIPLPHWVMALVIVALHLVFEQVDINYLIPRIIGRRMHLHPLVVILGIVAGASIAGVLGILLAAPTIASSRVLGRYVLENLTEPEAPAAPMQVESEGHERAAGT